ncbi:hypothetical protein KCH_37120 [Kitasatospora cheerisanensis KCTC 2395]|uniref:Uncharacterized protein n=1 Tax=Kitasatospora cheerisanensis KCTC 2395 TaxID=1348663 RepID=A0A066Z367_9ACTN|nr:hypothetical protein KCH_37120 [Kitasatospora cheerisanensis KCTC 2395]
MASQGRGLSRRVHRRERATDRLGHDRRQPPRHLPQSVGVAVVLL